MNPSRERVDDGLGVKGGLQSGGLDDLASLKHEHETAFGKVTPVEVFVRVGTVRVALQLLELGYRVRAKDEVGRSVKTGAW